MQSRTVINGGLVIAVMLAAGLAWQQHRTRRAIGAELVALEQQRSEAAANARRAARELAAAENDRAANRTKLEQLSKANAAAARIAPKPAGSSAAKRPWIPERLQNEPEFQVLWLADQRASLTTRYGPLFQKLGLTSEQIEKIQSAMIACQERELDLQATERAQGLSKDDPVVLRLRGEITAAYETAQKEVLGESGHQQMRDYERGAHAREIVAGLAGGAAVVAHDPLTAGQAEQLYETIANASRSYRNGGPVNMNEVDWDAVDGEVEKFLTSTQFAFFKTAEPPLPWGGRFQSRLYRTVNAANESAVPNKPRTPRS
jgi:hypothetical protein